MKHISEKWSWIRSSGSSQYPLTTVPVWMRSASSILSRGTVALKGAERMSGIVLTHRVGGWEAHGSVQLPFANRSPVTRSDIAGCELGKDVERSVLTRNENEKIPWID